MAFEHFALLVTVLALIYSLIARFVQMKLVDRNQMKLLQDESKALNDEYKKASDRHDQKRMDELMKQQMDVFPRMNALMMGQFKIMFVILAVFALLTWSINYLDPSVKDDLTIEANDSGQGCDVQAGDGVFSACVAVDGPSGVWVAHGTAYADSNVQAQNATAFVFGGGSPSEVISDVYVPHPQSNLFSSLLPSVFHPPLPFSVDARQEANGQIRMQASAPFAHRVTFRLDETTRFFVELPFTLPFLNVRRIYEPYWWFIFVAVTSGLVFSWAIGVYEKRMQGKPA